jgi:hypothetical protein
MSREFEAIMAAFDLLGWPGEKERPMPVERTMHVYETPQATYERPELRNECFRGEVRGYCGLAVVYIEHRNTGTPPRDTWALSIREIPFAIEMLQALYKEAQAQGHPLAAENLDDRCLCAMRNHKNG